MSDLEKAGGFQEGYQRALQLLERGDARGAEAELRGIQKRWPGEVNSQRVLGVALLAQGQNSAGIACLEAAIKAAPDFAHAKVDLALAYRGQGMLEPALRLLREALEKDATLHDAWRSYADLLVNLGDAAAANCAYQKFIDTDPAGGILQQAALCMGRDERPQAEALFRRVLQHNSNHIGALCGLAAVSLDAGYPQDAERLLRHALKQSAHMPLIWRGLAQTFLQTGDLAKAEVAVRHSLSIDDGAAASWVLFASVLAHTMRQAEALDAYDQALKLEPNQVRVALSRGHVLKTLGRRAEAEAAYQHCLELQPDFGEAYYSFADLKSYVFSDTEVAAMQGLLADAKTSPKSQVQIHFALGRAREQRKQYSDAFAHYAAGNSAKRRSAPFDAAAFEDKCRRVAATFSAEFFNARLGSGLADAAPIFIVGLPRSGSTLVEQVLASHSQVEGTMELPHVLRYVRELDHRGGASDAYPESVGELSPEQLLALGQRFLSETRIYRSGRARFIDKMPNNFSHIGLIHLMLPQATIIDVRRNPMDACFSAFKQHFAQGQSFSYDLEDLGRYYRNYVELMDHWDAVLPGKVFRLAYEDLVRDTEAQVRKLLGFCGLNFETVCLKFYESRRSVRTASSEQVRQPMYDSSVGLWRHFEPYLGPLQRSLGPVLQRFPHP
jgi:tetratricopeptide (TPR) repeat protein